MSLTQMGNPSATDWRWASPEEDERAVAFWHELAKAHGSPILELACGLGKVAIHLARNRFTVAALDPSAAMVAEARKTARPWDLDIQWAQSDLRDFRLGRRFSLILLPGDAIGRLLDRGDLDRCLECVRAHLMPHGRFAIEAAAPARHLSAGCRVDKRPVLQYADNHWRGTVVVSQSDQYEPSLGINRVRRFYKFPGRAEELVEESCLRLYFHPELVACLDAAGFAVERAYGDYGRGDFGPASPRQLLVCGLKR